VETTSGLSFVPIVPEPPASMPDAAASSALAGSSLEVELAGAVLRVAAGTDAELLTVVLRAVRASAG
jgi:transposase